MHFVAGSKTGICSPSEGVLTEMQERYGERLLVSWEGIVNVEVGASPFVCSKVLRSIKLQYYFGAVTVSSIRQQFLENGRLILSARWTKDILVVPTCPPGTREYGNALYTFGWICRFTIAVYLAASSGRSQTGVLDQDDLNAMRSTEPINIPPQSVFLAKVSGNPCSSPWPVKSLPHDANERPQHRLDASIDKRFMIRWWWMHASFEQKARTSASTCPSDS